MVLYQWEAMHLLFLQQQVLLSNKGVLTPQLWTWLQFIHFCTVTREQKSRPARLNLQLDFCWANANLQSTIYNLQDEFWKKRVHTQRLWFSDRALNQDRHLRKNYTVWDKKQGTQTNCGLLASYIKSFHHFFNNSIFKKTKIMVPSPITSWQTDGKQWK